MEGSRIVAADEEPKPPRASCARDGDRTVLLAPHRHSSSTFFCWDLHLQVTHSHLLIVEQRREEQIFRICSLRSLPLISHVSRRNVSPADLLHNPDFETPPPGSPANSTAPFLLGQNDTLPGWSFGGEVYYLTASGDGQGHAVQLGQDGTINQTFAASADYADYLVTFAIASSGGGNCSSNGSVVISAPDSRGVFPVAENQQAVYGQFLGSWRDGEAIDLAIGSETTESDVNATCWPVVDSIVLKSIPSLVKANDNELVNGGFEFGPDFLADSTEGVLLQPAQSPVQSPLRQWSILGTVKYIDSKHYFVPEGNAAVEIVSGNSSGIQTAAQLTKDSSYTLEFMLGDGNDSCVGDLEVRAQAGSVLQNYTIQSKGTGSAQKFSLKFKADSSDTGTTPISFVSYASSQTKDGTLCGPVVDNVVLRASLGLKLAIQWWFLLSLLLLVAPAMN
ncbi:uncharacterized protein J3R85_014053 [Psidium guajava]|nr:uncharacterized protein J3R85_014053 [Psidium guajava]